MTMSLTMPMPSLDARRRTSLPLLSSNHLTEEERAGFIVASSNRRPSVPHFYPHPHHHHHHTSLSSSPPSASYSSSSSGASSPREIGNCGKSNGSNSNCCMASSPILTPFQWTSDLRQYIMTDIGPQPSNSQMPTLRSHSHFARQRSCAKISPVSPPNGVYDHTPSSTCSTVDSSLALPPSNMTMSCGATYSRYSTITDLCTIPQDEILPPMKAPSERRFSHEEWDDEDD